MFYRFLDLLLGVGRKPDFETYLRKVQLENPASSPTANEALRDYQTIVDYWG
jgi:uncharacterized short protein YbdD (DUF466 family)